ncbi:MAG: hypothetical protein A2Y23_09805, partial [Clostridiales bacterium GWB2_37_7]
MEKPENVLPKPGLQKKEIIKRKTLFSNTYLNPNGSFTAEVSSAQINYKNKSGNWRSIDNRLLPKAESGYDYENAANAYKVKFARNNLEGRLVYLELDPEHWIAFSPIDRFIQTGIVRDNSILYQGIRTEVDLEYIIDGDTLKERIILNSPSNNVFRFELSYHGIRFEKDAGGILWAVDDKTGSRLMHFAKTYAVDSQGKFTQNIASELVNEAGKDIIVLTIDNKWLANATFPIVVDPAVVVQIVLTDPGDIHDTYIASGYATTTYYSNNYLHTGYLANFNTLRSLIKFVTLPSLPPGAKITSASLDLFMYLGSTGGTTIDIYPITGPWNASQTTWNNQPQTGSAVLTGFSATPNTLWNMAITSLVKDWYRGNIPNYGMMLRASNEASSKISFYSANEPTYTKPKLTINYEVDALGAEPYFGFHGNVNVHNGNLLLTDTDITLPGRGVPITVSRAYNLRSEVTTSVGYRWTLNVLMSLKYAYPDMAYFTDADGTTMTFIKNALGNYQAPAGVQDQLFYENDTFVLEEKFGTRYYFNTSGKLNHITDTNNNSTTFAYLGDGNIDRITDPSGREVVFNYTSGKLTSITGSNITTVEYAFTGNNLTSMKKKDASGTILTEESYGYDTWNNLITITDALGNVTTMTYSYDVNLDRRIYKVEKKLTIDGVLETLTTQYTYAIAADGIITTVTDPKSKITEYKTNNMGNVVKIIEDMCGLNINTQYLWDEQQNLVEVIDPKGEVELDPDKYKTVLNYDAKGDVKRIVNPKNQSSTYNYDTKSNPVNINDFAGRPTVNAYDPNTRNVIASADPLFSTSVMEYDSSGNIEKQTNPIGLGSNLVLNSGFEIWDGSEPEYWTNTSTGGTVIDDVSQWVNGSHSVKLYSPGNLANQKVILESDLIEVKGSFKYNVSWYVKATAGGANSGSATVDVDWYDAAQATLAPAPNIAATMRTTDGFIRKGARINAPYNAQYAKIRIIVTGGSSTAYTAWFDDIQFEYGTVINQYNLVFNSDFEIDQGETDFPDGWKGINLTAADVLQTDIDNNPGRCLMITGSAAAKQFYQEVSLKGEAGVPIHFSGWSKATDLSPTGGDYQLKFKFIYLDGGSSESVVNFNKANGPWHYREAVAKAPNDFEKLEIYGILANQIGSAYFDAIQVRLDGAPNALMSAYNIAQNGNFELEDKQTPSLAEYWVPIHSTQTPGTYDISWIESTDDLKSFSGEQMIRISNVPDWANAANSIREPIRAGKTYTASAVVKTENVTGAGAIVKFELLLASGGYAGQKISTKVLTGTQDWTRIFVSMTAAEAWTINPNTVFLRVCVGTIGATGGIMYFDAVRLLEGDIETIYSYDLNDNYVTAVRNQLGQTVSLLNDGRGNVTQMTDAKDNVYTFAYDKLDNIKAVENPKGFISYYFYDKDSNLTQIDNHQRTGPTTSAYLNTTIGIQYNELQLPKRITDGNWRATTFAYDKNTQLTNVKFPNLNEINYVYDAVNRLKEVTYVGDSTRWDYAYDADSNLTMVKKDSSNSKVTDYVYDNLDRLEKVTHPYSGGYRNTTEYTYNPTGQVLNTTHTLSAESVSEKRTQLVRYLYDQAGNNVDVIGPNNATAAAFMYDEELRLK